MPEIEIVKEQTLTYAEVKEKLDKIKKISPELGFRAKKAQEFLEVFAKDTLKQTNTLKEKLDGLGIQRLKERHITQLVNIHPEDEDSIKAILSSENLTLKQEDIKKIVDCLKQ
jgi:DNA-directed RNA polymerase subunit F